MSYEWFDSVEKLTHPSLLPMDAFWYSLKGHNVLEAERLKYRQLLDNGLTEAEALMKMKLQQPPPTK